MLSSIEVFVSLTFLQVSFKLLQVILNILNGRSCKRNIFVLVVVDDLLKKTYFIKLIKVRFLMWLEGTLRACII